MTEFNWATPPRPINEPTPAGIFTGPIAVGVGNESDNNFKWTTPPRPIEESVSVKKAGYSKEELYDKAISYAEEHGVRPDVYLALIKQESRFNPQAKSPTGARGISQMTLGTGKAYGILNESDRSDPDKMLRAGAAHVADLLKEHGNYPNAIYAYNGGSDPNFRSNVGRHLKWARNTINTRRPVQEAEQEPEFAWTTPPRPIEAEPSVLGQIGQFAKGLIEQPGSAEEASTQGFTGEGVGNAIEAIKPIAEAGAKGFGAVTGGAPYVEMAHGRQEQVQPEEIVAAERAGTELARGAYRDASLGLLQPPAIQSETGPMTGLTKAGREHAKKRAGMKPSDIPGAYEVPTDYRTGQLSQWMVPPSHEGQYTIPGRMGNEAKAAEIIRTAGGYLGMTLPLTRLTKAGVALADLAVPEAMGSAFNKILGYGLGFGGYGAAAGVGETIGTGRKFDTATMDRIINRSIDDYLLGSFLAMGMAGVAAGLNRLFIPPKVGGMPGTEFRTPPSLGAPAGEVINLNPQNIEDGILAYEYLRSTGNITGRAVRNNPYIRAAANLYDRYAGKSAEEILATLKESKPFQKAERVKAKAAQRTATEEVSPVASAPPIEGVGTLEQFTASKPTIKRVKAGYAYTNLAGERVTIYTNPGELRAKAIENAYRYEVDRAAEATEAPPAEALPEAKGEVPGEVVEIPTQEGKTLKLIYTKTGNKEVGDFNKKYIAPLLAKESGLKELDNTIAGFKERGIDVRLVSPEDWSNSELAAMFLYLSQHGKLEGAKTVYFGHGAGKGEAWRFGGTGENIQETINRDLPKGEKAFVMSCEDGLVRNALIAEGKIVTSRGPSGEVAPEAQAGRGVEGVGEKEAWEMGSNEFFKRQGINRRKASGQKTNNTIKLHERIIIAAAKEGKQIPDAVLEEYPFIARDYFGWEVKSPEYRPTATKPVVPEAPPPVEAAAPPIPTPEIVQPAPSGEVVSEAQAVRAYHGTTAEAFSEFNTEGLGSHFSSSPDTANIFAKGEGGRVYPVDLNLKNPLRIKDHGGTHDSATLGVVDSLIEAGALPKDYKSDAFHERLLKRVSDDPAADFDLANKQEMTRIKNLLQKQGYDGIVYDNRAEGGGDSYIVFDPKQAKPAAAPPPPPVEAAAPPIPTPEIVQPAPSGEVVPETQAIEDHIDSLSGFLNEGKKGESIRKVEKALDKLTNVEGIDEVRDAINEYKSIERKGMTPEEYAEAKADAFEEIQSALEGLSVDTEGAIPESLAPGAAKAKEPWEGIPKPREAKIRAYGTVEVNGQVAYKIGRGDTKAINAARKAGYTPVGSGTSYEYWTRGEPKKYQSITDAMPLATEFSLEPAEGGTRWRLYSSRGEIFSSVRETKDVEVARAEMVRRGKKERKLAEPTIAEKAGLGKGAKEPWEMSKEEFIANPPEGFKYVPDRSWAGRKPSGENVVQVSDEFFTLSPETKKSLIAHEYGHDLMGGKHDFNTTWGTLLEPFRIGEGKVGINSKYDLFKGYGVLANAEETLANAYSFLAVHNYKEFKGKEYDNLFRKIVEVAKEKNLPQLPPEVLADYPDLAKLGKGEGVWRDPYQEAIDRQMELQSGIIQKQRRAKSAKTKGDLATQRELVKEEIQRLTEAREADPNTPEWEKGDYRSLTPSVRKISWQRSQLRKEIEPLPIEKLTEDQFINGTKFLDRARAILKKIREENPDLKYNDLDFKGWPEWAKKEMIALEKESMQVEDARGGAYKRLVEILKEKYPDKAQSLEFGTARPNIDKETYKLLQENLAAPPAAKPGEVKQEDISKELHPEITGHEEGIKHLFAGAGPTPETYKLIQKLWKNKPMDISTKNMSMLTRYVGLPYWISKRYPKFGGFKIQNNREMLRHWADDELIGEFDPFIKLVNSMPRREYKALSAKVHNLVGPLGNFVPTDAQFKEIGLSDEWIKVLRDANELCGWCAQEHLPHLLASEFGMPKTEIDKMRRIYGKIKFYIPLRRQGKYYALAKEPAVPGGDEWAPRTSKKGKVFIFQSEEKANNSAKFINGKAEINAKARAVKTDAGWTVEIKDPGKKAETLHYELFDDLLATLSKGKLSIKARLRTARLRKEYPTAKIVKAGPKMTMPDEAFWRVDSANLEAITNVAFDEMRLPDDAPEEMVKLFTEAAKEKLKDALRRSIADTLNKRGFGRHFLPRKGTPGYDKTDILRDYMEHIRAYNGFVTKMMAAKEFGTWMSKLNPKEDPTLWLFSKEYVQDMMANSDEYDRTIDKVRGGFFLYFLGGVPRQLILQPTQNFIAGVPVLQKYSKWTSAKLGKEMLLAGSDILHDLGVKGIKLTTGKELALSKTKRLSPDEQTMLEVLKKRGDISDQMTREWMGYLAGTMGRVGQKLADYGSFFIGNAEILNRETFAVVAYRVARGELGLDHIKGMDFTADLINQVHFRYGKANLPGFARGGVDNKMARAAYTFRTYPHNLINLYRHLWREGKPQKGLEALSGPQMIPLKQGADGTWEAKSGRMKPYLKGLIAIFAAAGLTGLPGREWWEKEIQERTGVNLRSMVAQKTPEKVGHFINYGLPGPFGFSLAGSVSMDLPDWKRLPEDIIGVPASIAMRGYRGMQSIQRGDYLRGLEDASPSGVSGILGAYRIYKYGMTTRAGKDIKDATGEQIEFTPYEAAVKAGSFRTTKEADLFRQYKTQSGITKSWNDRRQAILDEYRIMCRHYGNYSKQVNAVLDKRDKFNDDWSDAEAAGVTQITAESLFKARIGKETKEKRRLKEAYP